MCSVCVNLSNLQVFLALLFLHLIFGNNANKSCEKRNCRKWKWFRCVNCCFCRKSFIESPQQCRFGFQKWRCGEGERDSKPNNKSVSPIFGRLESIKSGSLGGNTSRQPKNFHRHERHSCLVPMRWNQQQLVYKDLAIWDELSFYNDYTLLFCVMCVCSVF